MIRAAIVLGAALLVGCGDKSPAGSGECGDGVVDTGEDCDDGSLNGTTGCTSSCTFTCTDAAADCGAAPACQSAVCTPDHACIFVADATQDGAACGTGQHCDGGSCVSNGVCGNGTLEGTEACDFGTNNGAGSGCEDDCTLSCTDQASCDDGNLCNGAESCVDFTDASSGNAGKKCASGSAVNNGTSCGTADVCIGGDCIPASCGDSYATSPEECDDANTTLGDGCDSCAYSCVSSDASRNCTPADSCKGQGTCNDTNHTCTPGTPLGNNTPCGTGGYCKNTVCTQPVCPDGTKTPNETCDDGNQNNGDGCDTDCTYSCVTPAADCGTPPACQKFQCTGAHTCQAIADTLKNGMSCGTNGETCNNGACSGGVCGNAITETGEQCDFGSGTNGPGTGCETSCSYSCTISPNSCLDSNPCNGAETCASVTVSGHMGQKCNAGSPLADNTNCGTGKICKTQACVASVCGDGYVDASVGEYCEPPNSGTCDSKCRPKVCGDGILADNEQCDDGNLTNLDGCSKTCKFEQCQRINDLAIQFSTDATGGYCTLNALGKAIGSQAQPLITDAINTGVIDGSITIFFLFMGLDDLSGTSDTSVSLGLTSARPVGTTFDKGRWTTANGNADLDWWYTVDTADLDANRVPTSTISGSIAAKLLSTTPATMSFTVNFVGVDVTMNMFSTRVQVQTGANTTPTASSGTTPGHLAAEHLDPTIKSFESMGTHDTSMTPVPSGKLCGSTTAGSLYNTFVPAAVTSPYCPNYPIDHTLLDLYIGGCTYLIFFPVVKATQPDTSRSGSDTYRFQFDNTTHKVTSCTKNGGAMQAVGSAGFTDCLNNAGYTSYYKFTTDRVIGK